MLGEILVGAMLVGSPATEVRVATSKTAPETVSALSESAVEGLVSAEVDASLGEPWDATCTQDPCTREATSGGSAEVVVVLSIEQQDNVYRFALDARSVVTGQRLAMVEDVCEICGLEEVEQLVELRAAALAPHLEPPNPRERAPQTQPDPADMAGRAQEEAARRWLIAGGVSVGLGVVGLAVGIPLVAIDTKPYESQCRADAQGNCALLYDTMGPGAALTTAGAIGLAAGTAMLLIGRKHRRGRAQVQAAAGGVRVRF